MTIRRSTTKAPKNAEKVPPPFNFAAYPARAGNDHEVCGNGSSTIVGVCSLLRMSNFDKVPSSLVDFKILLRGVAAEAVLDLDRDYDDWVGVDNYDDAKGIIRRSYAAVQIILIENQKAACAHMRSLDGWEEFAVNQTHPSTSKLRIFLCSSGAFLKSIDWN